MKPLKSKLFRGSARMQRAANLAHNSLKRGVVDDAVRLLLQALANIEDQSDDLPTRLLPRVFVPPPTFINLEGKDWGPFFRNQNEFNAATFDNFTEGDIETFQTQAGNLGVDGRAGTNTIHRLDEIVAFLESVVPLQPFSPGRIG